MNLTLKEQPAIKVNGNATHSKTIPMIKGTLVLPPRVEQPRLIAKCEEQKTSALDKFIDRSVDALSSPKAIFVQTAVTVAYMAINCLPLMFAKFDPYPFLFLNFIYSLASGYATVFVLNSNRRQDMAARERAAKNEGINHKILERLERMETHLGLSKLDDPAVVNRLKGVDIDAMLARFEDRK